MNSSDRLQRLKYAFDELTPSVMETYRPWTYEKPIMVDSNRIEEMRNAQMAMLKLMTFIAENYSDICHLLPHDEHVKLFLKKLQGIPFQAGTFRTDFVIDETNVMKLIEVTCRYPLNGYFRSPAMNKLSNAKAFAEMESLSVDDLQMPILSKFDEWMGDARRFCIVQGNDNRGNESNYLPQLFEIAGIEIIHISVDEWRKGWKNYIADTAILAELDFGEWLSLPIEAVIAMLQRPLLNDPRLVFTVHDKGFFALIHEQELVSRALSTEELEVLISSFAETYLPEQSNDIWEKARINPSDWILKPRKLGRSVSIIAGALVSKEEWLREIEKAAENEMILQKWHESKKLTGCIGGMQYNDYFAGTLLYWGKDFFGPGMFRMSSHPVSNIVDDRKSTYLFSTKNNKFSHSNLCWI